MEYLSLKAFLIICPLLFLAGFIDSIAGGGGLISLPAYLFAGLPVNAARATTKLSSSCGTAVTTFMLGKQKLIRWKLALPGIIAAFAGSYLGTGLSLMIDEKILEKLIIAVLPLCAIVVLNKNLFKDKGSNDEIITPGTYAAVIVSSFFVGGYDGFYGPGAGTFLVIALTVLAKLDTRTANGITKAVNLTSNLSALAVFLFGGYIVFPLGIAGAAFNMLGNIAGSKMMIKNGTRIVRPVVITVLILLMVKLLGGA